MTRSESEKSCPTTTTDLPDATLAAELAKASIGGRPSGVRRFSVGSSHIVFEVSYVDRAPVVVRVAAPSTAPLWQGRPI